MWLKRLTVYLMNHLWQALFLTFAVTFLPLVGIVGILFAALVTMQRGMRWGAAFTVATMIPYAISYFASGKNPVGAVSSFNSSIVLWAAIGVAVFSNLLTWVFAGMLRKHMTWSAVLQIAALIGVFVVSLVHLAYPAVTDWWAVQLQSYYTEAVALNPALKSSANQVASTDAIAATKQYATGLMMAALLFNAVLQLVVARWWMLGVYPATQRLRHELRNIRLSRLAGVLFIACLALSYWGNAVALDNMPIAYVLFATAGLSLIHYFFGLMASSSWFWLTVVYLVLIFALPLSLFVLALIALIDVWFDLRHRVKKV